ncbi:hypothetical protein BJ912DRAFT_1080385 [Pholiota molesta]|nr:hypothetical protein BJ912DRAFT_1080385 [Pholiota molesta]
MPPALTTTSTGFGDWKMKGKTRGAGDPPGFADEDVRWYTNTDSTDSGASHSGQPATAVRHRAWQPPAPRRAARVECCRSRCARLRAAAAVRVCPAAGCSSMSTPREIMHAARHAARTAMDDTSHPHDGPSTMPTTPTTAMDARHVTRTTDNNNGRRLPRRPRVCHVAPTARHVVPRRRPPCRRALATSPPPPATTTPATSPTTVGGQNEGQAAEGRVIYVLRNPAGRVHLVPRELLRERVERRLVRLREVLPEAVVQEHVQVMRADEGVEVLFRAGDGGEEGWGRVKHSAVWRRIVPGVGIPTKPTRRIYALYSNCAHFKKFYGIQILYNCHDLKTLEDAQGKPGHCRALKVI